MARDELARGRQLTAAARALRKTSPRLATDAKRARFDGYMTQLETEEHTMPPKGHRAMGEDTTLVSVRLPRSLVPHIDAHVKRMRREHPDLPITRTHALSNLIRRACEALAVEDAAPGVIFAEPVPAAEVEPAASPTMVAMHDATENALAAIELATGQPIPRRRRVVSPLDQDLEDMPLEPPVSPRNALQTSDEELGTVETARPKAAAKKRTARTTKGRK